MQEEPQSLQQLIIKRKVTGFETLYATLNVTDWLYVKAGAVTVDVDTKLLDQQLQVIQQAIH